MRSRPLMLAMLAGCSFLAGCSGAENPPSSTGGAPSGGAATSTTGGTSSGAGGTSSAVGGTSFGAGGTSSAVGGTSSAAGGTSSGGAANGGAANGGAATTGGAPAAGGVGGQVGSGGGSAGSTSGTPSVRIVGRTAPGTNGGVRFSWPGVTINARFTGTQVSMGLNDGNNKNRFTVVVDGGTPKTLTTASNQTTISLATGLANGAHDLVVWRNTEASIGISEFSGLSNFGTGGALLAPAAAPNRRIEVIGDSLSVGAGVEGTSNTCNPGIDAFTNNYLAYGSVAARSVQADIVTIAWSGIGVYRSSSPTAPTMPARYDWAIPNDNATVAWDFSKYQPHVVVINLGTNDFNAGDPDAISAQDKVHHYVNAYVSFIQHVRSKYATAPMILIDMYGGNRLTAINEVISDLAAGGESKVSALSFSSVPNINTACNMHPNVTAQKAMGGLLATRLKSLLGW